MRDERRGRFGRARDKKRRARGKRRCFWGNQGIGRYWKGRNWTRIGELLEGLESVDGWEGWKILHIRPRFFGLTGPFAYTASDG